MMKPEDSGSVRLLVSSPPSPKIHPKPYKPHRYTYVYLGLFTMAFCVSTLLLTLYMSTPYPQQIAPRPLRMQDLHLMSCMGVDADQPWYMLSAPVSTQGQFITDCRSAYFHHVLCSRMIQDISPTIEDPNLRPSLQKLYPTRAWKEGTNQSSMYVCLPQRYSSSTLFDFVEKLEGDSSFTLHDTSWKYASGEILHNIGIPHEYRPFPMFSVPHSHSTWTTPTLKVENAALVVYHQVRTSSETTHVDPPPTKTVLFVFQEHNEQDSAWSVYEYWKGSPQYEILVAGWYKLILFALAFCVLAGYDTPVLKRDQPKSHEWLYCLFSILAVLGLLVFFQAMGDTNRWVTRPLLLFTSLWGPCALYGFYRWSDSSPPWHAALIHWPIHTLFHYYGFLCVFFIGWVFLGSLW